MRCVGRTRRIFFFSCGRRHTWFALVSWARRCVWETRCGLRRCRGFEESTDTHHDHTQQAKLIGIWSPNGFRDFGIVVHSIFKMLSNAECQTHRETDAVASWGPLVRVILASVYMVIVHVCTLFRSRITQTRTVQIRMPPRPAYRNSMCISTSPTEEGAYIYYDHIHYIQDN